MTASQRSTRASSRSSTPQSMVARIRWILAPGRCTPESRGISVSPERFRAIFMIWSVVIEVPAGVVMVPPSTVNWIRFFHHQDTKYTKGYEFKAIQRQKENQKFL